MFKNIDSLNISQIESTIPFGKINYFQSVDSTNSWLLKHGQCGDICISEMQNAGRGRRGNTWISPKTGNLYFSLCWCFDKILEHWSLLGLVVGVAIAETLSEIGLRNHGIKWPNDIFWQEKKLGGILLETLDQSGKVIIGIGLNLHMPSDISKEINQDVTSLDKAIRNNEFSRNQLVATLIQKLHQHLNTFASLGFDQFLSLWKTWDILHGETVSFSHRGSEIIGKVMGVDSHGRIGILIGTGEIEYFSSADIKIRKSNVNAID